MCKQYKEAEEQLLAVTGQERDKILYRSMLARTRMYTKFTTNLIINRVVQVENHRKKLEVEIPLKIFFPKLM